MNHKTNTLKNILQKNANFLQFLWKNIISLQIGFKSSNFATRFLTLKCEKFQKELQEKVKPRRNADLLICSSGISHNLKGGL